MTKPKVQSMAEISATTRIFFETKLRCKEFLDLIASCSSVSLAAIKWGLSQGNCMKFSCGK
jgi:hypothetical protein